MTSKRHCHRRYRRKNKRGGASYSSAATYSSYVNGSENDQYTRTLSQNGPYGNVSGNIIIGAQGQNSHYAGMPNSQQLSLVQKAGRRTRSRRKRGGIWGSVINQAIVPFSLLAAQQSYKGKKMLNRHTRRRHYKH